MEQNITNLELDDSMDPGDAELFFQSLVRSLLFDDMLRYITMGSPAMSQEDLALTQQNILPLALKYLSLGVSPEADDKRDQVLRDATLTPEQRYKVDAQVFGHPITGSGDVLMHVPNPLNSNITPVQPYPAYRPEPGKTLING